MSTTDYTADEDYRLDQQAAGWSTPVRAYGPPAEPEGWEKALTLVQAAGRLVLPVVLLLVLLVTTWLYSDALFVLKRAPAPIRDAGLAISDLILPGTWFAIHLTNRLYGPGHAFIQLVVALLISLAVVLISPEHVGTLAIAMPSIASRTVLAFGMAFLVANFVAIMFFDGARGPRWWSAPLAASLAASLVFSAAYYPAAFAGLDPGWPDSALVHFLAFAAVSALLLLPYWMLRPLMRPTNGMNGY